MYILFSIFYHKFQLRVKVKFLYKYQSQIFNYIFNAVLARNVIALAPGQPKPKAAADRLLYVKF